MSSKKNTGVSVHSGFPNPATDQSLASLNLNKLIIKHPSTTFFMRIDGNEWENEGIFSGDILIIDRSLDPKKQDKIIWYEGDTFVISQANKLPESTQTWGVVTNIIHTLR